MNTEIVMLYVETQERKYQAYMKAYNQKCLKMAQIKQNIFN